MPNILSALFLATSLLWYGSLQPPTFPQMWNDNCAVKWDPLFDNYTNFDNSYVYNNDSDIKHSKLFIQSSNKKCPLVDYYGKPYYDLQYLFNSSNTDQLLSNISNTGGGNIIVKTTTSGNELVVNQNISIPSNVNLIIPEGKELTNIYNNIITFDGYSNSNVLVLGGLRSNNNSETSVFYIANNFANTKVILGPNAKYYQDSSKYNGPFPVFTESYISKYLLYPGVEINTNTPATQIINNTFGNMGQLYLNRFINKNKHDNEKLLGQIAEYIHVIYSNTADISNIKTSYKEILRRLQAEYSDYYSVEYTGLEISDSVLDFGVTDTSLETTTIPEQYIYISYLPNVIWNNTDHTLGCGPGQYSFEEVTAPLTFIVDKTGNKAVLDIKPFEDNEFARYDAKLWNECKLNEGIYNLSYYNNLANKGNYINTNEMYKLFYDVINSNAPLKIATDTLYLGLLGTRPIELVTNSGIVRIFGNNIQYKGALRLPNTVTKVYYDNENSTISNLQHLSTNNIVKYINGKTPDLSGITFYYLNKMLSLNIHMHGNTLDMNLASERGKDSVLLLTDSATPTWQKKRVIIKGNNRDFKGVIITPPAVETIECYGKNACPKNIINISGKMLKFIIRDNPNNRLRGRHDKILGNSTMDVMSSNGTLLGNITTENTTIDTISGNDTSLENSNNSIVNNTITNNSLDKPGIIKLDLEDEHNTPLNIEKRNIIISTICAVFPKIPLICGKR